MQGRLRCLPHSARRQARRFEPANILNPKPSKPHQMESLKAQGKAQDLPRGRGVRDGVLWARGPIPGDSGDLVELVGSFSDTQYGLQFE